MAVKQVLFYATESDLKQSLERLERAGDIKYVATGLLDSPEFDSFDSFQEIEAIGISADGKIKNLVTYLIVTKNEKILPREVPQRDGGVKYAVDSRAVASSISFTPSGEYDDECIIYGTVSGVDVVNEQSMFLFKLFEKNFFKGFKKLKSFKVSPGAMDKLDNGVRLTRNFKADPSMDLVK